ncbi:MAG: glucosamine-6-phosphate deaminase [Bacillota bacterium]|nr:glucosamine-6-phosphate deaminase [Bacillota bacterium]
MQIYVKDDYDSVSKKAAQIIAAQMILKEDSVIGFATGSTPEGTYKNLVRMYKEGKINFSGITSFNLDEYYCIDPKNKQSYAYYMNKHLFDHVNIVRDNIHIPNGMSDDVETECKKYDKKIAESGHIDMQILGIGKNGHIGFNEPDLRFEAGTHLVELDLATIEENSRFFESLEDVPKKAISMGIRNIMHSKKIILIANGDNKSKILEEMLFGDITPNVPASILQLHNNVTLILDKKAAKYVIERLVDNK